MFKCIFHTISDSVYENELNYYKNKTVKIYNWYSSIRFFPADYLEKQNVRSELNISENSLVLISIGGCSNVKRHSEIINALPSILDVFPDTVYLHLGRGDAEEEEKNLVRKLGISKSVRFCGNHTNVRKFLIASDIYLMTSRYEGISITTIEALACKIPAILYNVPGLKDFNKYQENTIIIPENSSVLAEKILKLFNDKALNEKIKENGKRFVDQNYNLKTNVASIANLYK